MCPCFNPKISAWLGFLNLGKCPGFCYLLYLKASGCLVVFNMQYIYIYIFVLFKEIDVILHYNSQKIKQMTSSAV